MDINDVVKGFNTTPFLFIGSGLTRRYLNLPNWKELLKHFAELVDDNEFSYDSYVNRASTMQTRAGIMPKVAELIQRDFDEKWFKDPSIRNVTEDVKGLIHNGLSPFKAEISSYIVAKSKINEYYRDEIDKLSQISEKSIAGVITTNYDTFIEDTFTGYQKYIGQSQLIFSAIQGVSEIYKIHGSVEHPGSIVINEDDYVKFDEKCEYLAAKLMTIFMEYPIVFLGYSINDNNIQKIIESIINCLDSEQIRLLEKRFVFIEYQEDAKDVTVTPFTISVGGKLLSLLKVTLSDFMLLYDALSLKKTKLPARVLRRFKQEIYEYTLTNIPTGKLRIASIDDNRIADEDLILSIGKSSEFGLKGLSGLDSNEWYRDIVCGDLLFTADELLEYAYPKLSKQNSGVMPFNKYLALAQKDYPQYLDKYHSQSFETLISKTIRNNRKTLGSYCSIKQIWLSEKENLSKATNLISHLTEEQINISELEEVLREIFSQDKDILKNDKLAATHIRRLIRIYDYLKWGKEKELSN